MTSANDDRLERIKEVAELLGLSPEALLIAAAKGGSLQVDEIEEMDEAKPAPIPPSNLKFPKYKFREYPKLYYRGTVRDVEEPFLKIVPSHDGQPAQQINAIRVLPDQFVFETREVKNKIEEATMPKGWYKTLVEAKEVAIATKQNQRPIVVKDAPAEKSVRRRKAA